MAIVSNSIFLHRISQTWGNNLSLGVLNQGDVLQISKYIRKGMPGSRTCSPGNVL